MKKGDIVQVNNRNGSGTVIVEGKAELIKPLSPVMDGWQLWEVHFLEDADGETFYRRIPVA